MLTSPRVMLQLDAAGALVSLLLLGVILPNVQEHLGVRTEVLYGLALWAGGCLLYDLLCLRLAPLTQPRWLGGTILANGLYCVISAVLIVAHIDALTALGMAFFLTDILVVMSIVAVEAWLMSRLLSKHSATKA